MRTLPPFRYLACMAIALFASACTPEKYNPGDPASREWTETRILECLLNPDCLGSSTGDASGTGPGTGTTPAPLTSPLLASGRDGAFTAIIRLDRSVRAWGQNNHGQLGYNTTIDVGNGGGPTIIAAGDVGVGGSATSISMGLQHTCAVLSTGAVRCWGNGANGRLGYDSTAVIGNGVGSTINVAGDVPLGGTATGPGAGGSSTCAILSGGNLRCWGANNAGQLGYGNTTDVGDGGTSITAAGDVPVGGTVTQIALGTTHTCALLSGGTVRCWGQGTNGRLGYNATANVGDGVGVSIIAAGDVPVGGTVTQISAGSGHTCALLSTGAVRCWGSGANGRLGHNNTTNIGDGGLTIIAAGDIPLGGTAVQIEALDGYTCAVLTTNAVRCWGLGSSGRLGHNATASIGDGIGQSIIVAGNVSYE